jgi:hypothetical protein
VRITDFHAKYLACELTRRYASDSMEKLAPALADAQVDLNPHQVDAALFAFQNPFSKGAILADPWNAEPPKDAKALAEQLELHIDHILTGRGEADLLYEILLKTGYPPTTPVETIQLAAKAVYSAASGAFLVCLERPLTLEVIRAMAERNPERVVCLDEGFAGNDQLKTNAVQIFRTKGVVSFKTV